MGDLVKVMGWREGEGRRKEREGEEREGEEWCCGDCRGVLSAGLCLVLANSW